MTHVPETHEPERYFVTAPDGTRVTLYRTWTDEQITRMLRGALAIVDELDPPDDLRLLILTSAINLSGQMATRESKLTIAKPMSALDNNGGQ